MSVDKIREFLEIVERGEMTHRKAASEKYASAAEICREGGYYTNDGGYSRLTTEGRRELGLRRTWERWEQSPQADQKK